MHHRSFCLICFFNHRAVTLLIRIIILCIRKTASRFCFNMPSTRNNIILQASLIAIKTAKRNHNAHHNRRIRLCKGIFRLTKPTDSRINRTNNGLDESFYKNYTLHTPQIMQADINLNVKTNILHTYKLYFLPASGEKLKKYEKNSCSASKQ